MKRKARRNSLTLAFFGLAVVVFGGAVIGYLLSSQQPPDSSSSGLESGTEYSSSVSVSDASSGETSQTTSQTPPVVIDETILRALPAISYSPPEGTTALQKAEILLQNPELPTGCEATAATMVLRAFGYDITKETFATALPKAAIERKDDIAYGPDPNEAFPGDPFSNGGYGVFAPPIKSVMEAVVSKAGGPHKIIDLTGCSQSEILAQVDAGNPVCIWTTMGLSSVVYKSKWYIKRDGVYTDELVNWPGGEHCMALIGYDENYVTVLDPLKGKTRYDRALFFQRHKDVGGYALTLSE